MYGPSPTNHAAIVHRLSGGILTAGDGHAVTQDPSHRRLRAFDGAIAQAPAVVHMKSQDLRIQLLLPPCPHLNSERMLEFPLASASRHRRLNPQISSILRLLCDLRVHT
jgi:hypothetical protein